MSLSGVLISLSPTVPIAPVDLLKPLLPVVPTTERRFTAAQQASAFVRVYQGGTTVPVAVPLRISLRNADDALVIDRTEAIGAERFAAPGRAADVTVPLPVGRLEPGEYLLTLDASLSISRTATTPPSSPTMNSIAPSKTIRWSVWVPGRHSGIGLASATGFFTPLCCAP